MRIAQIPPLFETVPPRLYGGTERVVGALSDALVDMGHEVTVFSTPEAKTRAQVHCVRDQALRLDPASLKSELAAHLAMLYEVRACATRFDVLHFHTELLHLPVFEQLTAKCVTTLHGRLDLKDLERAYRCWSQFGLVSISRQQRKPLWRANWLATVPHGLPPENFPYQEAPGKYLAFLGRICAEKAPDAAIRIALRSGVPLKIAAKIDDADREYFNGVVKPLLAHRGVEFVGEISEREKPQFLGEACALLFPIAWPEPFGLVMIEAMACGTPVIAFEAGAVREVIDHAVSGLIVRNEEQAVAAVHRIEALSRGAVRRAFERRFTSRHMAQRYLDVYARLIGAEARPLMQAI